MLRLLRHYHSLNMQAFTFWKKHRQNIGLFHIPLLSASLLCGTSCGIFTKMPTVLESADQARKDGRFQEAIQLYKQHLQTRLNTSWKIKNENPYFWLLTVGDVYLQAGDPVKAQLAYDQARTQNVDLPLLVDRYLSLATWYKEHGNTKEAIAILTEYRSLDTLLFNGELDTISKELVDKEDSE